MKFILRILIIVLAAINIFPATARAQKAEVVSDYFPALTGIRYELKSANGKYPSSINTVQFRNKNFLQINSATGSAEMAQVYSVNTNEIRLIHTARVYNTAPRGPKGFIAKKNFIGSKPNNNTIILKGPLKTGTRWKNGSMESVIISTESYLGTAFGIQKTIVVKTSGKNHNYIYYKYFLKGKGIVSEVVTEKDKIISQSNIDKWAYIFSR